MARPKPTGRRLGFVRTLNYLAFAPLATRAPTYGRLFVALLQDPRIPASRKAILALAAGYVASPVDLIPETVPIFGALDDVAVVVLALDVFLEGIPKELLHEKLADLEIDHRELERDLKRARRVIPRPIRAAAIRLPGAIEGAASVIRRAGADQRLRGWLQGTEPQPRNVTPA